jgi:hypothetical protein
MLAMGLVVAGMGGTLGLAGCTDPIPAMQDEIAQPPQVLMTDYLLQSRLRVTVMPPQRVGSGQLKVVVQVRNLWDSHQSVDYMYWFLDKNGARVDNQSGWQFVKVPPRGIEQFEFVSMSAAAEDFRVQLRPAK